MLNLLIKKENIMKTWMNSENLFKCNNKKHVDKIKESAATL